MSHPLFSGSAIMIVGSNLANFFAYIYHLVIGRMLGPSLFGELAAIISLISLFTVTFNFFGLVVVKFVSAAKESEREALLAWFVKSAMLFGLIVGVIALILSPTLGNFLKVENKILFLIGPMLFISATTLVFRSFLQGVMRFKEVVLITNSELIGRLILGIIFIGLGYSVFGAIVGILVAMFTTLVFAWYLLKDYDFKANISGIVSTRKVVGYAFPILITSFATTSIFSTDLLLVKHYFSAHNAGIYASMSALGKIIFFGSAPVGAVMFPMISKRHARGQGYKKIFLLSLGLVTAISAGILLVYFLLPELMVNILYGSSFIDAAKNLAWFGLFMSIFSISSLIVSFFLSKGKTRIVIFVLLAAIVQAVGIWMFHESLIDVIRVNIASASFLLGVLLIYFGYEAKKIK